MPLGKGQGRKEAKDDAGFAAGLVAVRFLCAGRCSLCCSSCRCFPLLGTLVVNNGWLFSDALGHSALAGVGIGVLLGLSDYSAVMVVFAVVFALAMNRIRHSRLSSTDTVIGVFSLMRGGVGPGDPCPGGRSFANYQSLLIGDILSITDPELAVLAVTPAGDRDRLAAVL